MSEFKKLLTCCGFSCLGIFVIILINAFASISTNQYGLNYSSISETIEDQTYTAGFYFLGIGHSFITFPKSVITVDFSNDIGADYPPINSRTSDGLEVEIEVSFQYTLDPLHLYTMYQTFNKGYEDIFEKVAIDILTTNTTEYSAYNFFWNRQVISLNMQTQLNRYFEKWCFSQVQFFQLRSVQLPQKFEDSIAKTEVIKQSIQQAQAAKSKSVVALKTDLITAEFQKNVTINLAQGDAQQILLQAKAQANATKTVQHESARAYGHLKKTLNLDGPGLIKYIKNKIVRSQQDSLTISLQPEDSCSSKFQK